MKKTPNQIREELRRQMAKSHNDEIENLRKLKSQAWEQFIKADKECCKLKRENEELKDKVAQLEDWNRRLMEFMDMNEEERKVAIEKYKEEQELGGIYSVYLEKLFGTLGTFVEL